MRKLAFSFLLFAGIPLVVCGAAESGYGVTNNNATNGVQSKRVLPSIFSLLLDDSVVVPPGPPITLALTASRSSGVAPLAVFFDATGTTSTTTTMPFHEIKYSWNFGDAAGGATWAYGTRPNQMSKNAGYGAVAAHVFETPGTFTVTLTAFDGANTKSTTTSITVTDPNVVFNGTKTVCVANGTQPVAGANGCPAGAAVANLSSLANIADTLAQTSRRVLFKRGDAWDTEFTIFGKSDTILGAYGGGAPPLIRLTAANTNGFILYSNTQAINNFTVMDLDFVGAGGSGGMVSFAGDFTGSNFTALRLRSTGTGGISAIGNGISITDCNLQQLAGGGGYVGVYVERSTGVAIQGNRIYDATGIEHNIRTHSTKEVISNNTLYGPAATKQAITVRGTTIPNTHQWSGSWVEHIVVSDNDVDAGPNAGQLVEFAPTNADTHERIRDVIFERNYVHGATSTLLISEVSERATFRNNLFVASDNFADAAASISIMNKSKVGVPPPVSHFLYNNSFYRPAGANPKYEAIAVQVFNGNTVYPSGNVIKNNLAYAPFSTGNDYNNNPGPLFIGTAGPAGIWTLANNSTDAQMKSTAPGFVTPPVALIDWKPANSYAVGGGTAVPVWEDFFLVSRSGGNDMGAVVH